MDSETLDLLEAWRKAHAEAKECDIMAHDRTLAWHMAHKYQKQARNAKAKAGRLRKKLATRDISKPWAIKEKNLMNRLDDLARRGILWYNVIYNELQPLSREIRHNPEEFRREVDFKELCVALSLLHKKLTETQE